MNQTSQKVIDQFREMADLCTSAIEHLDKQIAWLSNLRAAVKNTQAMSQNAFSQVESGVVVIDDSDELSAALAETNLTTKDAPTTPPPPQLSKKRDDESQWEIMARLMGDKPRFTSTEAGKALEAELGRSLGPNRPQLVRNNLLRHPERFRRNGDGTWTVINITADGLNDDEVLEE